MIGANIHSDQHLVRDLSVAEFLQKGKITTSNTNSILTNRIQKLHLGTGNSGAKNKKLINGDKSKEHRFRCRPYRIVKSIFQQRNPPTADQNMDK